MFHEFRRSGLDIFFKNLILLRDGTAIIHRTQNKSQENSQSRVRLQNHDYIALLIITNTPNVSVTITLKNKIHKVTTTN